MNRTTALEYLTDTYEELATEANWSESVKLKVYALAIDQSLRSLGFEEDSLPAAIVPGEEIIAYLALLDYFALLRYSTAFATRSDVSVSGAISATQSQVWRQVRAMLSKAEDRLTGLGLSTVEQVTMGRLNLDYLEPDLITEGGIG